jgi:hypothetical protein
MACDEFEVDIERRRHGALDAAGAERLDRHLEDCPACRAYQQLVTSSEDVMSGSAMESLQSINWSLLESRLARARAWRRWSPWLAVAALAALVPLTAAGVPEEARQVTAAVGGALAVVITVSNFLRARAWRREVMAASESRGDLLAFWRKDLDRRIGLRRLWPVNIASGALLTLPALVHRAGEPALTWPQAVIVFSVAGLTLAQGAWFAVELGRLRRERAELG